MVAKTKSVTNLLHYQQKVQNDTIHALQVIHQSHRDHTNDYFTEDISTFYAKPDIYFNWILEV